MRNPDKSEKFLIFFALSPKPPEKCTVQGQKIRFYMSVRRTGIPAAASPDFIPEQV